jgi:hypothetical protein
MSVQVSFSNQIVIVNYMSRKTLILKPLCLGLITGLSLAMGNCLPSNAQSQNINSSQAEELLLQMTSYMKNAQSFSFNAEITQDRLLREDHKIKRGAFAEFTVKRPNQLRADYDGDLRDASFFYDGQNFTMVEPSRNVYGVIPIASDIDGLVDIIEDEYGFVIPMGSFIATYLHDEISEQIITSDYLGVANIGEASCHHLAFSLQHIDLQVWVAEGDRPLPCKFVITYREEVGFPQYSAIFSDWDFSNIPANDPRFTVTLPENTHQVEVLPRRLGTQKP